LKEFQSKLKIANLLKPGSKKLKIPARSFKYDLLLLDVQLTEPFREPPYGGRLEIFARKSNSTPICLIVFL